MPIAPPLPATGTVAINKESGAVATNYPGAQTRRFRVIKPGSARIATVYTLRTDLTPVLWQQDCDVTHCPGCNKEFGWITLHHHCRCCGLTLTDDCCPINEKYNDDRVCIFCLRALEQLNLQAEQEVEKRIQAGHDATKLLDTILPECYRRRQDIIQEEEGVRAELKEAVREDRKKVGVDIRRRIADVVGEVPEVFRRRLKPIFGIRGGILTIRVQRLRNLQPVKPHNTCTPLVYADVGHETKRSLVSAEPVETDELDYDHTTVGSLDFTLDHTFVFDVEDDRTGILLWLLDECSVQGVPVFLGIAKINIRQRALLLDEPEKVDEDIQELVAPYIRAPTREDLEAADAQLQMDKRQFLSMMAKKSGQTGGAGGAAAATSEDKEAAIQAALAAERLNSGGRGSGIGATPGMLAAHKKGHGQSTRPVDDMHVHHVDDFLPTVERGSVDVPIFDAKCNRINHGSLRVLWTLHPLKQDTRSVAARALMCTGCKQRDMAGFCSCDYDKRDRIEEKSIEERMAEKAKDLHKKEVAQRKKVCAAMGMPEPIVEEEKTFFCC